MKMSMRKGVFETNSSSTHAIMVQKNFKSKISDKWSIEDGLEQLAAMGVKVQNDKYSSKKTLDFSAMNPELAEFDRTEEAYNTWGMKLLYAIVSFRNDEYLWGALMTYLKKVGISVVSMTISFSEYYPQGEFLGHIDHESTGTLAGIFAENMKLDEYLERKDVYLVIDNEG